MQSNVVLTITLVLAGASRAFAQDAKEEPSGPLANLTGHTGAVICIAFSPNGQFAVTHGGLGDHSAHFWDIDKRKQLGQIAHEEVAGASIAWAMGGKLILTGGGAGSGSGGVMLQDPVSGKRVGGLITHEAPVRSVALTADGKRFASADGRGIVLIADLKTGAMVTNFPHGTGVNSVAFSPDGKLLVTGCDDHSIFLWNVEKDRQEWRKKGHTATVGCVAFSKDGKQVYSASYSGLGDTDGMIRIWEVSSGNEIGKLTVGGEGRQLMTATFSTDGRRALTGHENGEVCLWDLATRKNLATYHKHKHAISSVAFSPDGLYALSGENCQGGSEMWLYRLPRP